MNNQEAIEILHSDIDNKSCDGCQILCRGSKCPVNEALEMAIKALEQEPCGDAISRQAVFEQINCWIGSGEYKYTNATHYLTERVKHISPVKSQEPMTGYWNGRGFCSECGCDAPAYVIDWRWQKDMDAKYCSNCGARMVKPQEREVQE